MIDPDRPGAVSDAFLDRLVDGDLSPAELRAAVRALEAEPDGWKRCALAFLEAQAWRQSFRTASVTDAAVVAAIGSPAVGVPPRRLASVWRTAMAAGLAGLAFLLGWRLHPDRAAARGPELARELVAARPAPEVGSIVAKESSPPDPVPAVTTTERSEGVPPATDSGVRERWASAPPLPLTEHQQALLEQQGYQVDRRRRLVPATLRDGRRVAMPVDQVQVRYIGLETL